MDTNFLKFKLTMFKIDLYCFIAKAALNTARKLRVFYCKMVIFVGILEKKASEYVPEEENLHWILLNNYKASLDIMKKMEGDIR